MKKELGQYFTEEAMTIFSLEPFLKWYNDNNLKNYILLEPFIGKGDIIKALTKLNLINNNYIGYDISPQNNETVKENTLLNFPKNYQLTITNPPYLYKSVAKKNKYYEQIKLFEKYKNIDDLYELAILKIMENCCFAALIIPESFISSKKLFLKEHCECIISLTFNNLFKDTDYPVCLALFNKNNKNNKNKDIKIFRNNNFLGNINDIYLNVDLFLEQKNNLKIKFNDINGNIDISCIDNINDDQGIFSSENLFIENNKIKSSSRSKTRISIYINDKKVINKKIIKFISKEFNKKIKTYRKLTEDIFLSPFKGLRKDNKYRRRLDFETIKRIINSIELKND